ncbi:hypothetical protein ACFLYC_03420, partial [Chloroflexota bacterium]
DEAALTSDTPPANGVLAIIAPWVTFVGRETSMRVFLRADQEPFPGAGVWALTRDAADTLKAEINSLREADGAATLSADFEAMVNARGIYLGRTGADGRLYHTFEEAGRYVLVAVKGGYHPGFTGIKVREIRQGIGIEAPRRAVPDEEITIATFERATQEPLAGAGIWALTRDNAEALKTEMQALTEDASVAIAEKDYEALVDRYGFFLGRTGDNGDLNYAFAESGGYLLVAIKPVYYPGFVPISIQEITNALAVMAPWMVPHGREVTITALDRINHDPVESAGIWALSRDNMETLKAEIKVLRDDTSIAAAEKDYEALVSVYGSSLGRTDENGELRHTFDEVGTYLLVAVKRGYIPGFSPISIRGMSDTLRPASGTPEVDAASVKQRIEAGNIQEQTY